MEILLNRWRGTGIIFWKIKGVQIYALYLFILITLLSNFINGLSITVLFLIGESFSWGKWVGYLTEDNHIKQYDNNTGKSFPFIHYIANFFIKEKEDYYRYCQIALSLRGFVWWSPVLIYLGYIHLLDWYLVCINILILSYGFPYACYLGKMFDFEYKSKYLNLSKGWENQELIYGLFQFLCITLPLILGKII